MKGRVVAVKGRLAVKGRVMAVKGRVIAVKGGLKGRPRRSDRIGSVERAIRKATKRARTPTKQ